MLIFQMFYHRLVTETQDDNFLALIYHIFYELELHSSSSKRPQCIRAKTVFNPLMPGGNKEVTHT